MNFIARRQSTRLFGILLAICAGHLSAVSMAQERPWSESPIFGEDEGEVWKEGKLALPDFPRDDDLLLLDLQHLDTRYEYYIDPKSLSVGQDLVLRYTVVIESRNGGRNTFYEGLRCSGRQYRTYAHGRKGRFTPYRSSRWKPWTTGNLRGPQGFRRVLAEDVLCDEYQQRQRIEDVMHRLTASTAQSRHTAFPEKTDEGF